MADRCYECGSEEFICAKCDPSALRVAAARGELDSERTRRQEAEAQRDDYGHKWVAECDIAHNLERERDALRERLAVVERGLQNAEGRVEQWTERAERAEERLAVVEQRLYAVELQLAKAREVVRKYAAHPSSCPLGVGIGYYKPPADAKCDCGISFVLTDTAEPEPR